MSRKAQNIAPTTCRLPCTDATFERYHKARNPKETWDQMLNRVLDEFENKCKPTQSGVCGSTSGEDISLSESSTEEVSDLNPIDISAVYALQKQLERDGATLAPVEIKVPETLHQI